MREAGPVVTENRRRGAISGRKIDSFVLPAILVGSLALHMTAAARTVTFSDSGDFLMAISTVGNCHGPGYPLFIMTSKLFSWIFPFGSLAFRVSVLSGLFASLSACLIYWIIFRMAHSRVGGVVAAIAFTFSYTFWYQTVIPETYGMNIFFFALLVVLILRWERMLVEGRRDSADNSLAAFAFVFGLAMTNHFSAVFLVPGFFFFVADTNWREAFSLRNVFRMGAFFVLGLLPYIYEPTAAFRGPAYNYGDPSTLTRWFHHVTLYYQRGGLFNYPLKLFIPRFWRYFGTLTTEFPYFFWVAALGILATVLNRRKKYALFLITLFLVSALAVMSYSQLESVLRAHFYYPSYFVVALFIGFGAAWLSKLARRGAGSLDVSLARGLTVATAVVLIALTSLAIPLHYSKVDKSGYKYARNMAVKMMGRAGPDGIILTDSDNVIFPLKYMQTVEGIGKDVRVINPKSIGVPGWTAPDLAQPERAGPAGSPADPLYQRIARAYSGTLPVYSTATSLFFSGWNQQWQGIMNRIYPDGGAFAQAGPLILKPEGKLADIDSDAREAIALSDILHAYVKVDERKNRDAAELYQEVINVGRDSLYVPTLYGCETFANVSDRLGQQYNDLGEYEKTVRELSSAVIFNPDFVSLPLAYAYFKLGQPAEALNWFNKYILVNGPNSAAYLQIGEILMAGSDFKKAADAFRSVLDMEPANAQANYGLGVALLQLNQRSQAEAQFNAAIKNEPESHWADLSRQLLQTLKNRPK